MLAGYVGTALLCLFSNTLAKGDPSQKPNILFIALDDLNDWIGCMGGHPQTKTPNLDRLAESGVLFTNAHCPAASCNPSRTAILTGIAPNRSGLYDNNQKMREVLPDEDIIPQHFRKNGYYADGSGKILHYFVDAPSWDHYFPDAKKENPFPRTLYPDKRPLSLPRGGPWQYVETDWGPLEASDEEYGGDWLVADYVSRRLSQEHEKPFFLACGIYRPHEPWFVPAKYFEPFPLDEIQLPTGYLENDLDDLPEEGKRRGPNRYFPHIRKQGQWRQGIQGYLASIHFADAMLGRVLDALENGPNRDRTIVVLWSDHGWQLGEKEHWQKFTAWRQVTRVPLMIRVPSGVSSVLPRGTKAKSICVQPVNLLSLFPTLTELTGIETKPGLDGPSLVPLLKDPKADWDHVSITYLGDRGSFGLSDFDWRYIHYQGGDEELYYIPEDPYEWRNLIAEPAFSPRIEHYREVSPKQFAQKPEPSVGSLDELTWHPAASGSAPASRSDGNTFRVAFVNGGETPVELFWMSREGKPKSYGLLQPGKLREQETRPGAVWKITSSKTGEERGHFVIGDRRAKAIIPKQ